MRDVVWIIDSTVNVDSGHFEDVRIVHRLPVLQWTQAVLVCKRLQIYEVLNLAIVRGYFILFDASLCLYNWVDVKKISIIVFQNLYSFLPCLSGLILLIFIVLNLILSRVKLGFLAFNPYLLSILPSFLLLSLLMMPFIQGNFLCNFSILISSYDFFLDFSFLLLFEL